MVDKVKHENKLDELANGTAPGKYPASPLHAVATQYPSDCHSSAFSLNSVSTWVLSWLSWYLGWALPGLGMFSVAYFIFSVGEIKVFQQVMYPDCFITFTSCDAKLVQHVSDYIQICGIIAGMLLWGALANITGHKWGSRMVALIMWTGTVLLTFTGFAPTSFTYFLYFLVAQTWFGFGVGGEYPMASSSAAERSATTPELRHLRAQQVILVFSNQGMGNFVNTCVITVFMVIFRQTGTQQDMTFEGSKSCLTLMYGVGAVVCTAMVLHCFYSVGESKMLEEERMAATKDELGADQLAMADRRAGRRYLVAMWYFFPRLLVASAAWTTNDFGFYGNKLQQNVFLNILFPGATPYKQQQWNVLNTFIALLGYYAAALLCDKPWYGRVRCQYIGFLAMFVFNMVIYGAWSHLGSTSASQQGTQALQALYYLISFFNQFGPNATTWLVAGEIFPTEIRAPCHGFSAAMGKVGAIIASLWISYISNAQVFFLIAAIWALVGAVLTILFLPDTTGLELTEYDRMYHCMVKNGLKEYHGMAVQRKHLSLWEAVVGKWHENFAPDRDIAEREAEIKRNCTSESASDLKRASHRYL
ncbi:hypothetical protein CEUSTIGMA_g1979.t1 [Chlamydomonas eustigma]|uniref:Major facilitator superfamily (MFS) profile domain-containing protein n=1 Tax=Chlamydomonas eustigma TaxID=1157962 RepID=A0A250WVH2_9CHLO|nr:hypothetical protein CEUSTIGMA_g1979.t1 [Chlamydomonas eustigma]|eukprot:GAX74530.1 hypothetical protein CEUSTIGMA_g1979.t1 [Chlamydomonas eustigma]